MSEVEQADREAVTAFHNVQAKRILAGDRSLGENRDAIEQAFARHRTASVEAATADLRERLAEQAAQIAKLRAEVERLREAIANPPEEALRKACNQIDWCRYEDHDPFRDERGRINLDARDLSGAGTSIGEDMRDAIQAFFAKIDTLLGEPK